jgi:hypothetical protein
VNRSLRNAFAQEVAGSSPIPLPEISNSRISEECQFTTRFASEGYRFAKLSSDPKNLLTCWRSESPAFLSHSVAPMSK